MPPRKRIIFSLGFDTSGVISVLTELNLNPGDEIIFLIPSRDIPKSVEARENLERFLRLLSQRGLELQYKFFRLNEEDAESMILQITSLIDEGEEIYIEALGGLRSIVVAMTIAAILRRDKVVEFATIAESTSRRVRMPLPPLSPPRLDSLDYRILRIADTAPSGFVTLPYLHQVLEKPKTTLSDRLRRLESWGLLERIRSRPATYRITSFAKILLKSGR